MKSANDILKETHAVELCRYGSVAQLVEHCTFNAVVAGSSPARLTIFLVIHTGCGRAYHRRPEWYPPAVSAGATRS